MFVKQTPTESIVLKDLMGIAGKYSTSSGHVIGHNSAAITTQGDNLYNTLMDNQKVFWAGFAAAQLFGLTSLILLMILIEKYLGGLHWATGAIFNYHPLFMTIGLIYLFGNGMVIYRAAPHVSKFQLKLIHASLHGSAIALTVTALVAVFEYKKRNKGMDMYSLHSWIGMITAILYFSQFVFGWGAFLVPQMPLKWRSFLLPFHRFFGVVIFAMSLVSVLTGMTEKLGWTKDYGSGHFTTIGIIGNCYGLFVIVFGIFIVFLVSNAGYRRQPLPNELPAAQDFTVHQVN